MTLLSGQVLWSEDRPEVIAEAPAWDWVRASLVPALQDRAPLRLPRTGAAGCPRACSSPLCPVHSGLLAWNPRKKEREAPPGQEGWGEPTLNPRTFRGHSAWHWALPGSFLNGGLPGPREGPARAHDAFARAGWTPSGCRHADSALPSARSPGSSPLPAHPHSRLLLRLAPCPRSPAPPPSATPAPRRREFGGAGTFLS